MGGGEVDRVAGPTETTQDNDEARLLEMKVREGSGKPEIVIGAEITGVGRDLTRVTRNEIGRSEELETLRNQRTRMEWLLFKHP